MPPRSRDNLGNFFPNTPTPSNNQPSLFFDGYELEDPLGEQPEIFEEPIWEEEEETIPPTHTMDENRNGIENQNGDENRNWIENKNGDQNRTEGAFPIGETNGDVRMKNISPFSLPHFHGLTSEGHDTFLFEFVVKCKTYDYSSQKKKLKLFPSTRKDVSFCWFMGLPMENITTWAQKQQAFNNKYIDYCRSKDTKEEIFRMTLGHDESAEDYE